MHNGACLLGESLVHVVCLATNPAVKHTPMASGTNEFALCFRRDAYFASTELASRMSGPSCVNVAGDDVRFIIDCRQQDRVLQGAIHVFFPSVGCYCLSS